MDNNASRLNLNIKAQEMPPDLKMIPVRRYVFWTAGTLILARAFWPLGLISAIVQIIWTITLPINRARSCFKKGNKALKKQDYGVALDAFTKVLQYKPDCIPAKSIINEINRRKAKIAREGTSQIKSTTA